MTHYRDFKRNEPAAPRGSLPTADAAKAANPAKVPAAPAAGTPLRPSGGGWSARDWSAFVEARTSRLIAEGIAREQAKASAFDHAVAEWLSRNPCDSNPNICSFCCEGDRLYDGLLPHGTSATGVAWLHSACWPGWYADRKTIAVAALTAMGVVPPE